MMSTMDECRKCWQKEGRAIILNTAILSMKRPKGERKPRGHLDMYRQESQIMPKSWCLA